MPLVNAQGHRISKEDEKIIEEMLSGSIDSHLARLKEVRDRNRDREAASKFYDPLIEEYEKAKTKLGKKCREVFESGGSINASEFMTGYLDDIAKKAVPKVDRESSCFMEFALYLIPGFGNPEYLAMTSGPEDTTPVPAHVQDREESYEASVKNFKFSDAPMKGIENIGTYNPEKDSVKILYTLRTGNSTTMSRDVAKMEKEKEDIRNDPELSEREKGRRIKIIDGRIEAYKVGSFGLNTAAEISRIHSMELANKPEITAADLFRTLSELNIANRPGEPLAGKLRGTGIHAGDINGVSASRAPGILYKTLDMVAGYMNEIKLITDPALRKTRAIELASFADAMIVSEHVFADTNGRTGRMFTDTILQTFGLPPHTPLKDLKGTTKTLGETMDFKKRAFIYFNSVNISDKLLKESKRLREEKMKDAGAVGKTPASTEEGLQTDERADILVQSVRKLAETAGKRLAELESMSRAGHVNSDEYIAMHDALKAAGSLDPENVNITAVERALNEIDRTSKEYEKSHTGWFVANRDFGAKRLEMSKGNQQFVAEQRQMLRELSGSFDKMTAISGLGGKTDEAVSTPLAESKTKNDRVKNVKLSDLEEKKGVPSEHKTGKRNNSAASQKIKVNQGTVL